MDSKRIEVFFEFFFFGLIIGVIEDILAVKLATGEPITPRIIGIIFLIALPFAILGEIIADKIDFCSLFRKLSKRK